jgi:hypothetical protein
MLLIKGIIFFITVFLCTIWSISIGNYLLGNNKYLNFSIPFFPKTMLDGDTIHVIGIEKYQKDYLLITKKFIEKTYKVPVVVDEPIQLEDRFKINDSIFTTKTLNYLKSKRNTILITSNECIKSKSTDRVGGSASLYDNILIAKTYKNIHSFLRVLRHEIGHCQGLNHCNDNSCFMSNNRKDSEVYHFCKKCRNN